MKKRKCEFCFHNRKIEYIFERKDVKNINVRIKNDGSMHVSAPLHVPFSVVETFLYSKGSNISQILDKMKKQTLYNEQFCQYKDGMEIPFYGKKIRISLMKGEQNKIYLQGSTLFIKMKDMENENLRRNLVISWYRNEARKEFKRTVENMQSLFKGENKVPLPSIDIRIM